MRSPVLTRKHPGEHSWHVGTVPSALAASACHLSRALPLASQGGTACFPDRMGLLLFAAVTFILAGGPTQGSEERDLWGGSGLVFWVSGVGSGEGKVPWKHWVLSTSHGGGSVSVPRGTTGKCQVLMGSRQSHAGRRAAVSPSLVRHSGGYCPELYKWEAFRILICKWQVIRSGQENCDLAVLRYSYLTKGSAVYETVGWMELPFISGEGKHNLLTASPWATGCTPSWGLSSRRESSE